MLNIRLIFINKCYQLSEKCLIFILKWVVDVGSMKSVFAVFWVTGGNIKDESLLGCGWGCGFNGCGCGCS